MRENQSTVTPKQFGSLDGLRALSIAAVIWHHGAGEVSTITALQRGWLGVQLFFVISGFLITTLLLREKHLYGDISLSRFYARRSLRIFPLYYTVLALYAVLVTLVRRDEPAGQEFFYNLPYFATYTSNWFVGAVAGPIFVLSWSLAAEEQFYCTWPWVERYLRPPWPLVVSAFTCIVTFSLMVGWLAVGSSFVGTVIASVPFSICFGVFIAHILCLPRVREWSSRRSLRWLSLYALIILIVALQVLPVEFVILSMGLLVSACVLREDHSFAPVLRSSALSRIGRVSYGMYLFHPLVYNVLERFSFMPERREPLAFGYTFLATFLVAAVSFKYYESYFLRMKERFARRDVAALPIQGNAELDKDLTNSTPRQTTRTRALT